MIINVSGRNMKIGNVLQEKVEKKLSKFHRFFSDEAVCAVKMEPVRDDVSVEITLKIKRHYYRAEAVGGDAIAALEQAIDIMEGQIRKHKTKIKKRSRDFHYLKEYIDEQPEGQLQEQPEEREATIVRRKSFEISTMDPEEAVLQMELLGHSFFQFLLPETGKVALVYKRHDGDYGLIEPIY